ncbi:BMP family ABC transporter substrate-binding protein [Salipaludibacillus daqingensis]|uniref:BMP family ABC transporter substrate-binding protein n=1 Tax=Salipaludibacillus daqingensis TaxID=3041001 RepID=UPI0024743DB8|nr:BMP family ABC transporter substrate-binding protein [Salipaludibacillus daqingensis]
MKKIKYLIVIPFFLLLFSCDQNEEQNLEKVGLLLPYPIDDQAWNAKGYQGMLKLQSTLGVDVLLKEDIRSKSLVEDAIAEFHKEDVGIVFGHSHIYADLFMGLKDDFPDMHFISFNGEVEGDNITSLHFEGYAMGYFAGMLAAEMTDSNEVGVIAAFPFQPEVKGFEDGAKFHSDSVTVNIDYVESWVDKSRAFRIFNEMKNKDVDIFYPAGDGYHVEIIEKVKKEGLYAIGYVGDQLDLGESTVLTSTVQEVEKLYEFVATDFKEGKLESGNIYFDFEDGVITMGNFSEEVPSKTREWIEDHITKYIESGMLPDDVKNNAEGDE